MEGGALTQAKKLIEATCPDCRGPLSLTLHDHDMREYGCLVGHRYSADSLLAAHSDAQEKALWAAVVALEEAANLVGEVGTEFSPDVRKRLESQAELKLQQAEKIRGVLQTLECFKTK